MNVEWLTDWITCKQPWVLLGLPLLWVLLYYTRRKNIQPGIYLPTFVSLQGKKSLKTILITCLPWLRYLTLSFFLVALAQPQLINKEEHIQSEGIDIALVIDLSSSMLAKDFKPNRLEATKQLAMEFVSKRTNDRISLSTFAGEAFSLSPLTSDLRVINHLLEQLEEGYLEDGTAIGMGLASGVNRLKDSKAKSKVIILLTDGVNNAGYIDPLTAAKLADEYGIRVYVIGVGTEGEALSPVQKTRSGQYLYDYTKVIIDEATMTEIANLTKGQYFRATDASSLQQIYNKINSLEKTKIEKTVIMRYEDVFLRFLMIGIILLLLELVLRNTWLRSPLMSDEY